jgi:ribosomal protein L40E
MVKKTLGYVELEWTCPNCGTRNPGPQKMCSSCGTAQPEKVEFHQTAEEKLITDEAEIARAKAGPDVHCAFCGARNPAGTTRCTQCGADLSSAEARERGQILGAHRSGPAGQIACPQCGALNSAAATKCSQCSAPLPRAEPSPPQPVRQTARRATPRASQPSTRRTFRPSTPQASQPSQPSGVSAVISKVGVLGILAIVLLALVACAACLMIARCTPQEELVGQVQSVGWTRTIQIEELQQVTREDWRDRIPAGAQLGQCTSRKHHTQDNPAPNATEVCGTPYTVNTGSGYGEVVQDCVYDVYADWCRYATEEWTVTDSVVLSGNDMNPRWPNPNLGSRERERERQESYQVVFDTPKGEYTYTTSDLDRFLPCQVGSRWTLRVNALCPHPLPPEDPTPRTSPRAELKPA